MEPIAPGGVVSPASVIGAVITLTIVGAMEPVTVNITL